MSTTLPSINVITSGLDVQTIVDNLMTVARQPETLMQNQATAYGNKVSAFQALNTSLSTLMDKVNNILYSGESESLLTPYSFEDRLSDSIFARRKATSSDESSVSVTADKGTASGTYVIDVTNLAQARTMASTNFADTDTTTFGTGDLVFKVGDTETTVAIGATNNTLAGIRNAINSANAGVTATIINDGQSSPYRLLITSNETGTANAFTLTNTLSGPTSLALTETQTAEDSQFTVNSISITNSSNTVSGVIDGVTLNLKAETTSPVSIAVTTDIDSIVGAFKDLATAYNQLNAFYNSQFKYDSSNKTSGALSGDSTLRAIQSKIQQLFTQSVSNDYSSFSVLTQIGFTFGNNGSLTLNEGKLRGLLATDLKSVAGLMLGNGSPFQAATASLTDGRVTYSGKTDATAGGTYAIEVTGLAQQASVTGQKAFAALDADETLTITHGSTITTVDLLTGDDFETVLSKINGALSGGSLTAEDDGSGKIKIYTAGYGSSESVSVTSSRTGNPDNSTGFGNNPSAVGTDISGTINGHAAAGAGLELTGASGQPEEDLSLTIAQTTVGSYGTVTFTPDVAADEGESIIVNLRSALKGITDPLSGPIHNATDALRQNISRITEQISQFEDRLAVQRELLVEEYSRADQALRLLNVNQTSLNSQTTSLNKLSQ